MVGEPTNQKKSSPPKTCCVHIKRANPPFSTFSNECHDKIDRTPTGDEIGFEVKDLGIRKVTGTGLSVVSRVPLKFMNFFSKSQIREANSKN